MFPFNFAAGLTDGVRNVRGRNLNRKPIAVQSRSRTPHPAATSVRLGLRANWEQFTLLVAVNAFVGATVGIERVLLPLLAERDFGLASRATTIVLSSSPAYLRSRTRAALRRASGTWSSSSAQPANSGLTKGA